jgi:parallel beta-helix repeat protein
MKTKLIAAMSLIISAFQFFSFSAFSQGPLTPPGTPAPTMKSLDQIEARTPISSLPFVISAPGSYYLTKNLSVSTGTNAIEISANEVTLDLNGFTLSSTASPAVGTAIFLTNANGNSDVTIRNGFIQGGVTYSGGSYSGNGFFRGIFYIGSAPFNVRVTGVSVSGCAAYGIRLNDSASSIVESCTVQSCGNSGIYANTVSRCTVYQCGIAAIHAVIASDCYGYSTDGGTGIATTTANNCYGQSTGSGTGLSATIANNCYGISGTGFGISASNAVNCYGSTSGGAGFAGLNATTGGQIASFSRGVSLGAATGLIAGIANTCTGSSTSGTAIVAGHQYFCGSGTAVYP